jgi:hypothetical protein
MNANPSTYGALLLGALFASGFVSHFMIDRDTPITSKRQTLRHRHGAVCHLSEAFPVGPDVTEGPGTFVWLLLYTEGPNNRYVSLTFKVTSVWFDNLLCIPILQ